MKPKSSHITGILRFLSILAAAITAGSTHAAVVVTTEKLTPGNSTWSNFTTIANLSATDYANQGQPGNATFTVPTSNPTFGGGVSILNNGIGQPNDNDTAQSSFFDVNAPNRYLIDLKSTQNVSQFNSYSWHVDSRQNQAYSLYSSTTLLSANSTITDGAGLISEGWSLVGSVSTVYSAATPGQVGVSFTDSLGGSITTARYLLVDVLQAGGSTFLGEFDVVVVPEPTTWAMLAAGLTTVMVFRRRRRS